MGASPSHGATGISNSEYESREPLDRISPRSERLSLVIIPVLLTLVVWLIGLNDIHQATDPDWEDTAPYLQIGLFISQHGGATNFLQLCLSGTYTANNQHPLYPLLLSPFASRDLAFFEHAKLISLAMGWLAVLACFFVGYRLFGLAAGTGGATLLALNELFYQGASHVSCETALILFILLFLYGSIRAMEQTRSGAWAAFAGGCAGLAFMTKGTGLLLVPVYVATHLLQFGFRRAFNLRLAVFAVMFLLTASPLLVRNSLVYGNVTYGGINSHVLWLDSWADLYDPHFSVIRTLPEQTWHITDPPTWQSYLSSHSWRQIVDRVVTGMIGEGRLIRQSMDTLLPVPQMAFSIAVLLLSGLGLVFSRDRTRKVLVSLFLGAFILPFVWYFQVVPAIRFVMPLIPVICLYAAEGFLRLAAFFQTKWLAGTHPSSLKQAIVHVNGAGLLLIVVALGISGVRTPERHFSFGQDFEDMSRWAESNTQSNDLILMSTANPYWRYAWHVGFKGQIKIWHANSLFFPEADVSFLKTALQDRGAARNSYAIIHEGDLRLQPILTRHFDSVSPYGLIEKQAVDGWQLIYTDSSHPAKFLIYRVHPHEQRDA
ncbi:hypothetical protein W02_40290 [Nitrospira sp. KM1]|uniref:ArnT family glycosyltransferase n=1 Tax=Nitrospira sp. KM1 TaxID=1936990 RepID=UPI0013A71EC6|nr:glycosyltransferase family 39 protein [Nitrospira sp. KM1]BCA56889.1 hypothetical protein W02_40290 [Nitrospira sp. KM1]